MTQHPPDGDRLAVTPPLDPRDAGFLAGFSPHAGGVARIWPGQPVAPSPWLPCEHGCCLVLAPTRAGSACAAQWLRFLVAEFLGDRHRLDGWLSVPGPPGLGGVLLIVEAGDVFEGDLEGDPQVGSSGRMPAARAGSA